MRFQPPLFCTKTHVRMNSHSGRGWDSYLEDLKTEKDIFSSFPAFLSHAKVEASSSFFGEIACAASDSSKDKESKP